MPESNVIIVGTNGIEIAWVKPKHKGKRFFETKRQTYRTYSDGYVRMKIIDNYHHKTNDSEVIIYNENSIYPYDNPNDIDYSADAFEEDYWLDKMMADKNLKKKLSWQNIESLWQKYSIIIPFAIIGIVVAVALIQQGGLQ